MEERKAIRRFVNWVRLHYLAVCMIVGGVAALRLSHLLPNSDWGTVLGEVGAIALVGALGGFLWEVLGRLSLLNRLMEEHGLCASLAESGLMAVLPFADVDWIPLFRDAHEVDLCFCLGRAWREHNLERLRQFARAPSHRLRVILPDPSNPRVLTVLTERFRSYKGDSRRLRKDIDDSIEFYRSLQVVGGASVEVLLLQEPPLITFYRFGDAVVLSVFTHRTGMETVPAILARRASGGLIYGFVLGELQAMLCGDDSLARLAP